MSVPIESPRPVERCCAVLREAHCDFAAVREAVREVRGFLAGQGLGEEELAGWELALTEAANNAVEHASPEQQQLPVRLEVLCGEHQVEARITDHTPGFDLPAVIEPPGEEAEGGRGLFVIKALTDTATYLRGGGENVLVLRKRRSGPPDAALPVEDLAGRLAEAERALAEMTEELAANYESLAAIFRHSAELRSNPDLRKFARHMVTNLAQVTQADLAVLRLVDDEGSRLVPFLVLPEMLANGVRLTSAERSEEALECVALRSREDAWFDADRPLSEDDPLRVFSGLRLGVCHAFSVEDQPVGTLTLARTSTQESFTAGQINLMHTLIDFLGLQMANLRLQEQRTEARLVERELHIAARIQQALLPGELPCCPPFQLAAYSGSARQVGGDFYDVIPVENGGVLLVIADVMGKGVPSALLAAVLRGVIRAAPRLLPHPGQLLEQVNRTLFGDFGRAEMFATAALAFADPVSRRIVAASAGHCPLLVAAPGAEVIAVDEAGLPLGIEEDSAYAESVIELPPRGAALLYTDGVTDTRNPAGEFFGEERLHAWLEEAASRPVDGGILRQGLVDTLKRFQAGAEASDDQTFLLLRDLP